MFKKIIQSFVLAATFFASPAAAESNEELLTKAKSGNVEAQVSLGRMYGNGDGVELKINLSSK